MKKRALHKRAKPSRARRARRLVRRGLEVGVVAVAVGWFIQSVLLPWLIKDKVTSALAGLGFENARFEVRSASFTGTRLADLSAAGGDLRVGTLDVSYSPLEAASGELDVIRIGGAEIRLTVRDGQANLGPPAASSGEPAEAAGPGGDANAELPFRRLEVASSSLRLDWEGRELWMPVSGTMVNHGKGVAALELDSFAFGSPVEIAGTLDLRRGTSHVSVSAGQADLAALLASIPANIAPAMPVRAGGRVAVQVVYDRDAAGAATVTASLAPRDVWLTTEAGGTPIAVDGLTVSSRVVLDDAFHVTAVEASGVIAAVRAGGEVVRDVELTVATAGQAVAFNLKARGASWQVRQLAGTVDGVLGPPSAAGDVRVAAELTAEGQLPPALLDRLNAAGVSAAGLGSAWVNADGRFTATRAPDGNRSWVVDVPGVRLTLPTGDVTGPGGAKLVGLAGVLNLGGKFGPDGGDVFLHEQSWIGFRGFDAGSGDDAAHVGETLVALAGDEHEPLANVRFGDDGIRLTGGLNARNDAPLTLDAPGMTANFGKLTASGKVTVEPGSTTPAVRVTLGLADASVTHAKSGLALAGISAQVPLTMNAPSTEAAPPGRFEVKSVALGKEKFESIRGTLGVRDGRAVFSATWAALPDAVLDVNGWLASGADGPAGEVTATVPSFELDETEADALADRIPALEGWSVTGTFAADAKLEVAGGRLVPRATLKITGVDAGSTEAGIAMKGLTGVVTLDSFAPPATPGGQRIAAKELAFGKVQMTNADLAFRVERDAVLLERVEAGWLGGRVYTHGVRLDFADPKVETTLYAENISLEELLKFAAEGRATGEGVMFGKLPVAVEWPRVRLGRGYLHSQSPAGAIQVLDTQLLAETMERSDPRFLTDPDLVEVKDRVVRALSDFEYDALTFNFDEESGGLVRINTHGKGRVGDRPQELDMTLNVRGANDLLNHYLQMKTKWDELSN